MELTEEELKRVTVDVSNLIKIEKPSDDDDGNDDPFAMDEEDYDPFAGDDGDLIFGGDDDDL